jgi:tetratricopeptide (TPR) repeat protein
MSAKKSGSCSPLPGLLLTIMLALSCRPVNTGFEQAYAETLAAKRGPDLILALSELDQRFPDQLKLKITLGGLLLAAGDLSRARIVLERGEELARRCRDDNLRGLLFTNLAELCYRRGEYSRGLACSDRALSADPDQALGVAVTRAKCLCALGRYKEALDGFRQIPESEPMTAEDLEIFAALLLESGEAEEALNTLQELEHRHGYSLGLGLQESAVYEQLGRFDEAVMAAAKDMEYRRSFALIDDARLLSNLQQLAALLPGSAGCESDAESAVVRAYSAFVRGQWPRCVTLIEQIDLRTPFYNYLLLASLLESGAADPEQLTAYRRLKADFRFLPAYYYHLWRGLKAGNDGYTIFTARSALETCILLAPGSQYARESRSELGRLLGLTAVQGEKLLLGAELDGIYARLAAGADPQILQPALEMLLLPENVYRSAAVLVITRARRFAAVEDYLSGQPRFLALLDAYGN